MELTYRTEGDYQLPNLEAPEAPKVGKYGMLRRSFLANHRHGIYTGMLLTGELNSHLAEIDRTAGERVNRMVSEMAAAQGVNEALKERDPMAWVGAMNSLKAQAEEIVLNELVYA